MKVTDTKIDAQQLQIGMFVCELDIPWKDSPFLIIDGFMLKNMKTIKKIQQVCSYVYIDKNRSAHATGKVISPAEGINLTIAKPDSAHAQPIGTLEELDTNSPTKAKLILGKGGSIVDLPQPEATSNFIDELYRARKTYAHFHKEAAKIFLAVEADQAPVILSLIGVILEVIASIKRNPSSFQWIVMTNPDDKTVKQHCINVCIQSLIFGHQIGLPDRVNSLLGMAGLTFDVGKLVISDAILKKPARLSDAEMDVMKKHVIASAEILQTAAGVSPEVINVCRHHHEHVDGSGYPDHLKGEEIDLLSRIIAIIDTYHAIIATSHYSGHSSPNKALDELYKLRNHAYDSQLVEAFIRSNGMFPVGTAIVTQTGEIGLVVSNDVKHKLSPSVLMVLDAQKRPYTEEKIIDFSRAVNDQGDPLYSIKQAVNVNDFGINAKDCFRDQ
ncbi:MAG: HD domain-containing phosphohydrolase [Gammaproteobacteria bacterium]